MGETAPCACEVPPEMRQGFVKITPTADRRDRMLAREFEGICEALGSMRAGLEGGAQ